MSNKNKRPERKYVPLRRKKIDKPTEEEGNPKKSATVFKENDSESGNVSSQSAMDKEHEPKDKYQGAFEAFNESDTTESVFDQENFTVKEPYESDPKETFPQVDPIEDSDTTEEKNHDLVVDPEMPYFFVFGLPSSGKTAMLSGLIYYLKTLAEGQLRTLNDQDKINHRKGQYLMAHMQQSVRSGKFVTGTKAIDKSEFVFPNEINLEFIPDDLKKPIMPFCLLDMAGEDQSSVMLFDEGLSGGELDIRIKSYLEHADCSIVFIFVVDVDSPAESEDLIDRFLDYMEQLGHTENPVLFTVNKWDIQRAQYESVEEYFEQNLLILNRRRKDQKRLTAIMDFSIGEVHFDPSTGWDTYKYNPKDSERLMKWMYEIATGYSMDEEMQESNLKQLFNRIKKGFRNE